MLSRVSMLTSMAVAAGIVAGGVTFAAQSRSRPVAPTTLPMHLFLLAGQSNMAGRGQVADEDRVVHPRVLMFDRDLAWTPAVDPMHFDKPVAAVGPGRSFGIAVAESNSAIRVGLVPAAVGGSPITAWQSGAFYEQTGSHPWDDAIRRMKAALPSGQLKAILWHQGESDATPQAAPLYEARLRALIERFRVEFGNPSLPVIIGQLGRFEGRPWSEWYQQVDAAHQRVAAEVPHVVFVSSEGLTDNGDLIHFSARAARELGRRYAAAYFGLLTLESTSVAMQFGQMP